MSIAEEIIYQLYSEIHDVVERYTLYCERKIRGAQIKSLRSRVGDKIRKTNKVRRKRKNARNK